MLGHRNTNPALIRTLFGFKKNAAGKPVIFGPLDYLCVANNDNTIVWPPTPAIGGSAVVEFGSGNPVGTILPPARVFVGGVLNPPNAMIDPADPANVGLLDVTGQVGAAVNVGDAIVVDHDAGQVTGSISGALAQYPAGDPGSTVQSYRVALDAPADIRISGAPAMFNGAIVGMLWLLSPGAAGLCIRLEDIKVN